MKRPSRQRGMAVISALLIATVVAVIAAGMIARQSQLSSSLASEVQRVQGIWLIQGVQVWAAQLLWRERQAEPLTRLDQRWARPLRDLQLAELSGAFDGRIEDEQGKFNLRNLVIDGQLDSIELEAFQRLCSSQGVAAEQGGRIVQRIVESYSIRSQPVPAGGSEPSFDSGRVTSPNKRGRVEPPKRPMLRRFDDLASVAGIKPVTLARLRPYVTFLPATTWINGNTASAEVLAARVPGLSLERARTLVAERDRGQWFINTGDVLNRLGMPQLSSETLRVGITSNWFMLRGYTRVDQRRTAVEVLLLRPEMDRPQVVWSRVGA